MEHFSSCLIWKGLDWTTQRDKQDITYDKTIPHRSKLGQLWHQPLQLEVHCTSIYKARRVVKKALVRKGVKFLVTVDDSRPLIMAVLPHIFAFYRGILVNETTLNN